MKTVAGNNVIRIVSHLEYQDIFLATQLTITYSKSTIETAEKDVKQVQS